MAHISRRSMLTIVAGGGAALTGNIARAMETSGRVIYPVAVPIYQTQFVADRIGYFKEAGLDCKLIQGGSGVKTREIIASSQGDIGIGVDVGHVASSLAQAWRITSSLAGGAISSARATRRTRSLSASVVMYSTGDLPSTRARNNPGSRCAARASSASAASQRTPAR